ncbi:DUF2642 domain-containing protein [Lysinibacillus sp. NPDC097287]|uniref:DUF2642 domain-containing protein n=1 Tax=Lysinibacillus sp. NPDC097287 TaxID=3364144 RepID=UPI00382DB88D
MIQNLNKETVKLYISGKKVLKGIIVDSGSDMIVLYNGEDYYYIPNSHIHELKVDDYNENNIIMPTENPDIVLNNKDELTLEKVLSHAVGIYSEIYVTGNQALHGYISNIMSDYFVFQSPIYKTMYIKTEHLKWLIPYTDNLSPYKLSAAEFPIQPFNEALSKTFETQIDTLKGKFLVFNQGEKNNFIGRMNNVKGHIVEFQTARMNPIYFNLLHIKTVHQA